MFSLDGSDRAYGVTGVPLARLDTLYRDALANGVERQVRACGLLNARVQGDGLGAIGIDAQFLRGLSHEAIPLANGGGGQGEGDRA